MVERLFDIELYRIISCSDSFDIPINIFSSLYRFDVINIDKHEKVDEHSNAANNKPSNKPITQLLLWNNAWDLQEKIRIYATDAIILCYFSGGCQALKFEFTRFFARAVSLELRFENVLLEVARAIMMAMLPRILI